MSCQPLASALVPRHADSDVQILNMNPRSGSSAYCNRHRTSMGKPCTKAHERVRTRHRARQSARHATKVAGKGSPRSGTRLTFRLGRRRRLPRSSPVAIELTFLGNPFERLAGTLDAVLVVIPVGRQQLHDLVGPAGASAAHRSRGEIHGLADRELVSFQRYSPARQSVAPPGRNTTS